jgi:phage baseplate assembly protein gpV
MLLKKGLIDVDMMPLSYGQVNTQWEKIKPMLEAGRKKWGTPKLGNEVEYLCDELKKREQRK